MNKIEKGRIVYTVIFFAVLLLEILIALFLKGNFIRAYGGDILVTFLICSGVRIFLPRGVRLLPLWVLLFATIVEVAQYFDIVSLLGLGNIKFFRILIGTTFSFADLLCYAVGCLAFLVLDVLMNKKISTKADF